MTPKNLTPEQRSRLEAEVKSPFKPLRRFLYVAFALSGGIGAYIFLIKLLAGEPWRTTLPNLIIQVALTAIMAGLLWVERD